MIGKTMGKTVLITGASSGIGNATAQFFAAQGWNVIATARSPESVQTLKPSDRLVILRLDVTQTETIAAAMSQAIAHFGKIDVLVNNAGFGLVTVFEASTAEQIQNQFATNVFGLFEVTRDLLPHFREQKSGVIINVASMGGRIAFPFWSIYHATKWAVEGFSESLQYELAPFGIRVKIIEPGVIRTAFSHHLDSPPEMGLAAYDKPLRALMQKTEAAYATGPTAEVVAKVIYRAATDKGDRLRYAAAAPILALRRLLPDRLFFALIRRLT